ncbi:hypothetical protein ABT052_22360 [Streptomyces sp. NPDC002766]|uniref:hypothetical protein n=1 Tax=Streptomyces sp. NPDC002766 TaxID=3154429 RepID=UPI003317F263
MPDAPGDEFRGMGEPTSVGFTSEQIQLVNLMREPAGDEYQLADMGRIRCVGVGPQEEDWEEDSRHIGSSSAS